MNILRLIVQSKKLFSASEWKVAQFILKDPSAVLPMNISMLAKAASVSTTTINRFYKVLNISSFSDFKVKLSSAVANQSSKQIDDVFYRDLEKNDSVDGIAKKIMNNTMKAYQGTMDRLDSKTIKRVCQLLYDAEEAFVLGVGASALTAENMMQKWNRIGKRIQFDLDMNILLVQLVTAKPNSVLFLISNSGNSPELVNAATVAKDHGVTVVSLTGPSNNALSKLSDVCLQTAMAFEGEYRIAATTSLSAQFFVINILFYSYVNIFEEDFVQMLEQTHDSIERYKKRTHLYGGDNS